jgi:hypothetical protein
MSQQQPRLAQEERRWCRKKEGTERKDARERCEEEYMCVRTKKEGKGRERKINKEADRWVPPVR